LIKPPVKECTKPTDPTLYSDVRAVERAEFDNQVRLEIIILINLMPVAESIQKFFIHASSK